MRILLKKYWVYFLLLVVLFLAFPLLFTHSRKMIWDITLLNLPWRYQLSQTINSGYLPLWNPYINNGFPQMGQYETWYPVSWFISLVFGYNMRMMQYEYLFDLLIAGIGFYKLSSLFVGLNKVTRISGAIAYMLCGVFVSQASHFGYVTAGAWMTFVFYFLIKFLQQPSWRYGVNLVLFYYLLMTGGYPGNTIVITYICFIIFAIYLYKYVTSKHKEKLMKLGKIIPILIVLFLSVYAIVFYTTTDFFEGATRQKLSYGYEGYGAASGSNSWASYLSLIVPSVTSVENDIWQTYRMVNDSYIGFLFSILPIFYLIYGRKHKFYKVGKVLFAVAIFFLFVSLAIQLPLHKLLYHIVPFIDRFRFPSLFRIFFILNFILISLLSIDLIKDNKKLRQKFSWWIGGFISVSLILLFFTKRVDLNAVFSNYDETLKSLGIKEMLHIDLIILIVLGLLFIVLSWKKPKYFSPIVLTLISIDLILHTWILNPLFVSTNVNPKDVDKAIAEIPEGYPLINQQIKIKDSYKMFEKTAPPLWLNRFAYNKYPMMMGANPFQTQKYRNAKENGDFDILSNYPFIAVFSDFKNNKVDTSFYKSQLTNDIVSTFTSPNEFDFEIKNAKNNYVLFNHNAYKYWNFYENGQLLTPKLISTNYLAVKLTSNQTELKIIFENNKVNVLFKVAVVGFILLIALVIMFNFIYKI